MDKFFRGKSKQDIIFILTSFCLSVILVFYIVFLIGILIRNINQGIDLDLIKNQEIIRFNFNQLEQLKKR
ncbi:MAG: hypothetical protein AAB847_01915 [Patescibacteria group bacterium]